MSDSENNAQGCESGACPVDNLKKRVRGLTSMSLEWLAERFRKSEAIKEKIASGTYQVDSTKLAKAVISAEPEESK